MLRGPGGVGGFRQREAERLSEQLHEAAAAAPCGLRTAFAVRRRGVWVGLGGRQFYRAGHPDEAELSEQLYNAATLLGEDPQSHL